MHQLPKTVMMALAGFVLLFLAGCGDSSPTTYAVKAYSGGEAVSTFDAASYNTGDGRIYADMANGRKNVVAGTYSVRRTDPGNVSSTASATKYIAELYSGGKVVETVNAASYSTSGNKVSLTVSLSNAQIIFGGTCVLKHVGANVEGKSDASKYKVTVYSDGVPVGTWYADSYSTGTGGIILTVNGISEALIIGGSYVVEQFR